MMMRGMLSAGILVIGLSAMALVPRTEDAEGIKASDEATVMTVDEQAVHDAVLDYVEAIYNVEPEQIDRSVHPTLRKHGYWREGDGWNDGPMTFPQLQRLAAGYNRDGHIGDDAPKEIVVLDVLDKTASAKLTAEWGVDYFHLAQIEGRWQIMNILWQSPPEM